MSFKNIYFHTKFHTHCFIIDVKSQNWSRLRSTGCAIKTQDISNLILPLITGTHWRRYCWTGSGWNWIEKKKINRMRERDRNLLQLHYYHHQKIKRGEREREIFWVVRASYGDNTVKLYQLREAWESSQLKKFFI